MAKVYVKHPETGGGALVDDEEGVIESLESRGWVVQDEIPDSLNPDAPNTGAIRPLPEEDEPAEEAPVEEAAADETVSQENNETEDGE